MRFILSLILVFFAALFFSCSKTSGTYDTTNGTVPAYDIQIRDNQFSPGIDSVALGASIRFVNVTGASHTLISDDTVSVRTPSILPASTYTFKINNIGIFRYHCIEHPAITGIIIMRP